MAYTTIDDPSVHFQVTTYTGDGGTQDITHSGNSTLQADMIWIKNRTAESNHILQDTTRGITKQFFPDNVAVEYDSASWGHVNSVSSNGFQVDEGNSGEANANKNSQNYVSWNWKINGGTTSSNSNGSLASTVQVSTTAGISIFTFTTDGTTTTVGHGLGSKPDLVIFKSRNVGGGHLMITDLLDGSQDYLYLNLANAKADIGYAVHTSSVVEYNDNNTNTQVAYAFKNIQGYSKFGTYYGNGISDGTFAYCGFKPAWVMIKNTGSSEPWVIFDTERNPNNIANLKLVANSDDAENAHSATGGAGYNDIDILSTGFKLRTNNGATNESAKRFLFMAFAESPFVSSEGVPTTAR